MDEKTPATRPAAAHRPARRRALAAAALLLSVTAAVSACGGNGAKHNSAGAGPSASASASTSASPSAGAGDSASPSAPGSAAPAPSTGTGGTGTGGTGAGAPTPPPQGGAPSAPVKTPGSGVTPEPVDPIHPSANFKPISYLTNGNQLTVFFVGGICDKYGLKIDESKQGSVGVDVVATQDRPTGQMCPALAKQQSVVGTMSKPLDGRSVVSLRDGSPVPLESAPNGGPVSAGN